MGTKKLADRPWLIQDSDFEEELNLKKQLQLELPEQVFADVGDSKEIGEVVLSLIEREGVKLSTHDCVHPLAQAGLSVQEDLCLMNRTPDGWILKAASLCFPSRWQLREKIGKDMSRIHGPVDGYEEHLSKRVNNFFDRLGGEPVWRRNWFIHPDNSLYQPQRPPNGDPIIGFGEIGEKLFVRSERQTLQLLEIPGWILFTIRVQRTPLENLLLTRKEEFQKWIFEAPDSHHDHKGLVIEQVAEIQKALVN